MKINNLKEKIKQLKIELQEKEKALPAHSVTPYQMRVILELEEKIIELEKELDQMVRQGERS